MVETRVAGAVNGGRHIVAASGALAWMDSDIRARFIVGEDLSIHWANAAAGRMLRRGTDIDKRGDCLVFADSDRQAKLIRRLSQAESELVTCSIPLEHEEGHLLVRGRRLDCEDETLFGLVLIRTDGSDSCRFRDLDTAFGLTPAENRVLLSLLDGKDADQITRDLAVSMVTVRTHVRNIYAKLDVNSRERLFAKALPFLL